MKYSQFAKTLQKLEETSKRLEITAILADLIKELDVNEIDKALYLSRGYLKAEFESEKSNIAEKMMVRILAATYNKSKKEVRRTFSKVGDLGTVAFEYKKSAKDSKLSILQVHEKLLEIARTEGAGSQERKVKLATSLLQSADPLSAKYIVRTILGTNRLGFTELTIIDGLVQHLTGGKDKETKQKIEDKYRSHPDIGLVAKRIKEKGLDGIKDIKIEVGVPVHAQKPQRLGSPAEIIERMKVTWLENKLDGTRVQLHMDRNKKVEKSTDQQDLFDTSDEKPFIKTFTRNLEETTHQFPDIIEGADKQIDADSVIFDGEAIGWDKKNKKFLPFQETIQRKRKHGIDDAVKEIPLKYYVFDILLHNGKSTLELPLTKRRELLEKVIKDGDVIETDEYLLTDDVKKVAEFSKNALDRGLEGIMAKSPDSSYRAGARGYEWVKLKRLEEQILSDTIDCVILGYYHGRGVRADFGIGGFLVGIYDPKTSEYKTITKVGTGLKDDQWKYLKERADKIAIQEKPKNVDSDKKYDCDVWVKPEIVVEIAADEISKSKDHSAGLALRFPRLIKFRDDKSPTDTTTPKELKEMQTIQNGK